MFLDFFIHILVLVVLQVVKFNKMSERKVLNKYYPPDYDPALIPKLKLAKDRQYVIRVMAPFHMRCKTCGNYIYKGTKFNSRKETVQDEDYIGLRIFRFYIKCTKCVAEITFKTDPENTDYVIEHGATRNFEAEKILQQQEKEEERQQQEDEGNPMKLLENRTRDSKREMERMENLEELMDLNKRQAKVNFEGMLKRYQETEEERKKRELEEDEEEVKNIFGSNKIRRLNDEDEENEEERIASKESVNAPSDLLISSEVPVQKSIVKDNKPTILPSIKSTVKKKPQFLGIVKKKNTTIPIMQNQANLPSSSNGKDSELQIVKNQEASTSAELPKTENKDAPTSSGGLGLLGAYGSDDSNSSSEEDQ